VPHNANQSAKQNQRKNQSRNQTANLSLIQNLIPGETRNTTQTHTPGVMQTKTEPETVFEHEVETVDETAPEHVSKHANENRNENAKENVEENVKGNVGPTQVVVSDCQLFASVASRRCRLNRVGGGFAVAPSHTTGRALLHPAVRQGMGCTAIPAPTSLDVPSSSAGEDSALWLNPGSFTAFAQPVVSSSEEFRLLRLSHEPLKFPSSSTFGPSCCSRTSTMASADSCHLNPTSRSELLSADRVAAGLPR